MITNDLQLLPCLNLGLKNTIRDAFKLLNGVFGMIVTIVDESESLRGIATDGDLRKALLRGYSLDSPLDAVMNVNPLVIELENIRRGVEFYNVVNRLKKRGVAEGSLLAKVVAIPVINKNKNVLGFVTLEMLETLKSDEDLKIADEEKIQPKILVVGGAGFIGSVLIRMLLDQGYRLRVLDKMLYGMESLNSVKDHPRSEIIVGDATDINCLVEAIKGVDSVVYLSEIVGDPACAYVPDTALKTNYLAVSTMANLCSHIHINRFVYTSSCSVYGATSDPNVILDEKSKLNPVSHYGRMKILSEQAILSQLNPMFSPTILRLATVFGHSFRPRFDLVVNTFAKNAYFKESITVHGGSQWRPNIHITDVAKAIIKVLKSPLELVKGQIINVGNNSENHTIDELAELTLSVFQKCKIKREKDLADSRNYRVNFNKMEDILQFEAKETVVNGLIELKGIFERKEITDPDDARYNNLNALRKNFNGFSS